MDRSDIIPAIARRDRGALEQFQGAFGGAIHGIALRMTRDVRDAEEVVQDVTLAVHRHAGSFRGDSDPWRWVHRITRNKALTVLRRRRGETTSLEPAVLEAIADASDLPTPARPDQVLALRHMTLRIEDALAAAEPTNRDLFTMMDVDGASKEEASAALGLSVPAVKARLHRVRAGLRAAAHERPAPGRAA